MVGNLLVLSECITSCATPPDSCISHLERKANCSCVMDFGTFPFVLLAMVFAIILYMQLHRDIGLNYSRCIGLPELV